MTAIPAWRRELAEKKKQRVAVNRVQTPNKENEPKTSPVVPRWKKEVAERRKRREMSPSQAQPDKRERSPEIPEWQRRLANTRRTRPVVVPRGPVEDPTDQVPSFMKEFERKKRTLPRGTCFYKMLFRHKLTRNLSSFAIQLCAYLSNTLTNLCIALYFILLYCVVLNCIVLFIYCYVDMIQYNAMHKFVGVLDNPHCVGELMP